jgi:hypothetical protein
MVVQALRLSVYQQFINIIMSCGWLILSCMHPAGTAAAAGTWCVWVPTGAIHGLHNRLVAADLCKHVGHCSCLHALSNDAETGWQILQTRYSPAKTRLECTMSMVRRGRCEEAHSANRQHHALSRHTGSCVHVGWLSLHVGARAGPRQLLVRVPGSR